VKRLLIALAMIAVPAGAAQLPRPGNADPRIRFVVYDRQEVVTIRGQLGYQIVMGFGIGERIENVAVGDSQAWQVTPNRRADLLFIKPIDRKPSTNMAVVTNLRRYNFELIVAPPTKRREQVYDIRFTYPDDEAVAAAVPPPVPPFDIPPPLDWNYAYSYSGARENVPARVFDDRQRTYFEWPEGQPQPAVFIIGVDGKEALVNHITRGRFLVIEQVGARFVLRNGTAITEVFNDAMRPNVPGPEAPAARDPKAKRSKADGRRPR